MAPLPNRHHDVRCCAYAPPRWLGARGAAGVVSLFARGVSVSASTAGVDPTLEGRALQDALLREIATRRGYRWWDVDHAGWVVTLDSPREQFYGRTLEEALAWCLVWLMAPELGIGPFLAWGSGCGRGTSAVVRIPSRLEV